MQWDKGVMPLTSSHQKQYLRFEIQIPRNLKTGRSEKKYRVRSVVRTGDIGGTAANGSSCRQTKNLAVIVALRWNPVRWIDGSKKKHDEHCVPPNVALAPQNLWETHPFFWLFRTYVLFSMAKRFQKWGVNPPVSDLCNHSWPDRNPWKAEAWAWHPARAKTIRKHEDLTYMRLHRHIKYLYNIIQYHIIHSDMWLCVFVFVNHRDTRVLTKGFN